MALPLIPIAIVGGLYGIHKLKKAFNKEEIDEPANEKDKKLTKEDKEREKFWKDPIAKFYREKYPIYSSLKEIMSYDDFGTLWEYFKCFYFSKNSAISSKFEELYLQKTLWYLSDEYLDYRKCDYIGNNAYFGEVHGYEEKLLKKCLPESIIEISRGEKYIKIDIPYDSNYNTEMEREERMQRWAARFLLAKRIHNFTRYRYKELEKCILDFSNYTSEELIKINKDESIEDVKRGAAIWIVDKQDLDYEENCVNYIKQFAEYSIERLGEVVENSSDEAKKKAASLLLKDRLEKESRQNERELEIRKEKLEIRKKELLQYYRKEFSSLSKKEVISIVQSLSDEIKKEVAEKVLREMEEADR